MARTARKASKTFRGKTIPTVSPAAYAPSLDNQVSGSSQEGGEGSEADNQQIVDVQQDPSVDQFLLNLLPKFGLKSRAANKAGDNVSVTSETDDVYSEGPLVDYTFSTDEEEEVDLTPSSPQL
jgi:hypothetical protein